ncbi:hypothetical protein P153DRAFT_283907 [Dothidotthia symphoricarpi CBS 119687]|uniref:Heterokaryon incompatibility domain-containing protein n=1 Tax=Dothidotthia symphoricarpi CBS 119687 TaxID=1392245 RepID=A0A6A6APW8_9PLEO|nr:uncharacterized protein P153DRAFT_283907 [Dothidotthia symphoricarpi CBS 119687]KAF2133065.1 hypothetical protein P153DRAFT_283907 [Dothidotthia symphoricarpi CBS 119687]
MATAVYYPDEPLQEGEIRLIRLLAGEWTTSIQCHLFRADTETLQYRALSYVWGSQRVTRPVLVNGVICQLTFNLESALRHLREKYKDGLVLWVDALCINQDDVKERTQQVQLMGQIYQSCQEVIVYLGDRLESAARPPAVISFDPDTPPKLEVLDIHHKFHSQREVSVCQVFEFLHRLSHDYHLDSTAVFSRNGEKGSDEWNANFDTNRIKLFEALRRLMYPPFTPFWNRIWVVQELVFAPQIIVVHGTISAPWSMFARAASSYINHSLACCSRTATQLPRDQMKVLIDCSHRILDIEKLRDRKDLNYKSITKTDALQSDRDRSLLALLCKFRDRKASDPRDKVYALLSMVQVPEGEPHMAPDYSLSEVDVFRKATLEAIYGSKSLRVFSTELGRKFRDDLPSWVPDWGAPGGHTYSIRAEAAELYDACPGTAVTRDVVREEAPCQLSVQGVRIAMVEHVDVLMLGDDADACRDTLRRWWDHVPFEDGNYFWRIICADVVHARHPGVKVRRTIYDDELSFITWAQLSKRSPFKESCKGSFESQKNDHMWSDAARAWREVLLLWPDMVRSDLLSLSRWFCRCVIPHSYIANLQELTQRVRKLLRFTSPCVYSEDQLLHSSGDTRQDAPWKEFRGLIWNRLIQTYGPEVKLDPRPRENLVSTIDHTIMAATLSRRLIRTGNGYIGLGPAATMVGDEVFILRGGKTPFVLRRSRRDLVYEVVGDCYMQGLMYGEGREGIEPEDGWENIVLI